jgi:group I intron endonuclease
MSVIPLVREQNILNDMFKNKKIYDIYNAPLNYGISGIYIICSVLKPWRLYVGSSYDILYRFKRHLGFLRCNDHHSKKLQSHYNKYGEKDLRCVVAERVCQKELLVKEQYWIDVLNPWFNGSQYALSIIRFNVDNNFIGKKGFYKRPVLQLSLNGDILNEWDCADSAAKHVGVSPSSIRDCLYNKGKTSAGYIWKYKEPRSPRKKLITRKLRFVYQFDLNRILIKKWDSIREAAVFYQTNYSRLFTAARRDGREAKGFLWSFNETCGIRGSSKICHSVKTAQHNLQGYLLNIWDSRVDAEKNTGVLAQNIAKCCAGHRKSSGGFIWKNI